MKKKYCKPEVSFENFEMCSDIAKGCYFHVNNNDCDCTITHPGWPELFWYGTCNGQAMQIANDTDPFSCGEHDKACYHGPSGGSILFTS